jgi:hypothetical protein
MLVLLHGRRSESLLPTGRQYKATVTDLATLVLEVTAGKKIHRVLVYGHNFLTAKEDQDAVDRFLGVWSEVLRAVLAPNPDQKPDQYRPGKYRSRQD